MKIIDIPLRTLYNIDPACLCLHNLYIVKNNEFFIDWTKEIEKELQTGQYVIKKKNAISRYVSRSRIITKINERVTKDIFTN